MDKLLSSEQYQQRKVDNMERGIDNKDKLLSLQQHGTIWAEKQTTLTEESRQYGQREADNMEKRPSLEQRGQRKVDNIDKGKQTSRTEESRHHGQRKVYIMDREEQTTWTSCLHWESELKSTQSHGDTET